MNILVINGSPKGAGSNTVKLANAFVKGIQQECKDEAKVEQLDLKNLHIEGCKGCFACWKKTPGTCCIRDDMKMVIEKLLAADVIIYSFPLYYFNIPGTLKNLIDRQLPMVLPFMSTREDGIGSGSHDARYDMSGKRYVLISTCGFYSAEGNYDSVCRMFDHICGKENYETLFCGQGELFRVKELSQRTDAYLKLVEGAGAEFISGEISEETKARLKELLYPREVFEKMADASWGVSREEGKEDKSLVFTRQMAALYNKNSYDGKDRVLEICYTDLGKTYQIALTKDGSKVFTDGHLKYTTRIDTPFDVWLQIAQNEIRGDEALMKQMYRVSGDFSFMMKWDTFFGTDTTQEQADHSYENGAANGKGLDSNWKQRNGKRPPVMTTMLIAWITFWVAVSIDTQTGAFLSLAVSACLPLIMNRNEMIIYDKLSIAITALLSILALATNQGALATNLGYLLFGVLWISSCLLKEPLCACYVKYDYNGEDALNNPIFMKTNFILAMGWGILYIAIAVWTWFLSKTDYKDSLIILNNIMPLFMGIFTGWFQKWYPAWIAKGKRSA